MTRNTWICINYKISFCSSTKLWLCSPKIRNMIIKIIVNMSFDIHWLHHYNPNFHVEKTKFYLIIHFFISFAGKNWNNSAKSDIIQKIIRRVNLTRPSLLTCKQFSWWLAASGGEYSFKLKLLKFQLYNCLCIFEALISASVINSNKFRLTINNEVIIQKLMLILKENFYRIGFCVVNEGISAKLTQLNLKISRRNT